MSEDAKKLKAKIEELQLMLTQRDSAITSQQRIIDDLAKKLKKFQEK